jgi:hypothetical protein
VFYLSDFGIQEELTSEVRFSSCEILYAVVKSGAIPVPLDLTYINRPTLRSIIVVLVLKLRREKEKRPSQGREIKGNKCPLKRYLVCNLEKSARFPMVSILVDDSSDAYFFNAAVGRVVDRPDYFSCCA